MNQHRRRLAHPARVLALALAALAASPGLARAQVYGSEWGFGYPLFGYGVFGYPGFSYGSPRFGYPFYGFPIEIEQQAIRHRVLEPFIYEYGYPGIDEYPHDIPVIPLNFGPSFEPIPLAFPRVLPSTGNPPLAVSNVQVRPRIVKGAATKGGSESAGLDRGRPQIYRGPPPLGSREESSPPTPTPPQP
ncbi:MAG: hypothetical protein JO252_12120 [Planctomycetaceae bacterium]|nr:hypothetical protein [Planctomycetaceae bacterium]